MKVKIRNTNGSPDILVETTPVTSVQCLQLDIARQLNIESDRIRLIFNGHLLVANSDNLQRHNIMEGSVLHCVPRPLNVPPSPAPSPSSSIPRPMVATQNPIMFHRHRVSGHFDDPAVVGSSSSRSGNNSASTSSAGTSRTLTPAELHRSGIRQYENYERIPDAAGGIGGRNTGDGGVNRQTRGLTPEELHFGVTRVDASSSSSSAPNRFSSTGYTRRGGFYYQNPIGAQASSIVGTAATSTPPTNTPSIVVASGAFGREIERAIGNLHSTAESVRRYLLSHASLCICTNLIYCESRHPFKTTSS